jgi:lysophospholipase L1-like esterase
VPVVACLGASATEAKVSHDWVRDLAQRPDNRALSFRKFAKGGDLAFNGLDRLPELARCQPARVVILLGNNDVLALVSPRFERYARARKHLNATPSPEWYGETMRMIVQQLKRDTGARIALCSLLPMGEDPQSAVPFQAEINRRVREYSQIIAEIASDLDVTYIPVYERLLAQIEASPGRALAAFRIFPFYRDAFRMFVLKKKLDEIARINGWRLHTDGIHLNSDGGKIVADLVQAFIDDRVATDSQPTCRTLE